MIKLIPTISAFFLLCFWAGDFNGDYPDSAEIYDSKASKFPPTAKTTAPRSEHIAVLLKNGDVLITGGHKGRRSAIEIHKSAEIYNPRNGTFPAAADLTIKRRKQDAVLLDDGRVLIVGGADERVSGGAYGDVEIYNPTTNNFSKAGDTKSARYKLQGTSILLRDGKFFIAGGSNHAELFAPKTNFFEIIDGTFESALLFSTATLLPNEQIWIIGGYDQRINISSKAWIYE